MDEPDLTRVEASHVVMSWAVRVGRWLGAGPWRALKPRLRDSGLDLTL